MKYFDRNTVKTTSNWQVKQSDRDFRKSNIQSKNRFKKEVQKFSYKVSDKLWWNSLNFDEQSNVYREYMGWNTWYSYPTNSIFIIESKSISAQISEEDHNNRMEVLMNKYNNPIKRRDLVIKEILNFE